jgi:hypothetical protein
VDESGNQIAVFGRIGSRPFNLEEMRKLYLDKAGKPWFVSDAPGVPDPGAPRSDSVANGAAPASAPGGSQ